MEIKDILLLLGGLALFLHGMQMMSNGLETAAGNRMKTILEKLTSNRLKGVAVGAVITAAVQSSSATTVMVVGFVNSGLMTLKQAVWVIMGANVGTTITGQLIALDIKAIAPLFAFGGIAAITFIKNDKVRHISGIFAGLGVLFIGMGMMGDAMVPLRNSETFINFMTTFNNPLIGILIGAVFTAIIQSSSASVGILQALAGTGMIPLSSAVYILFGQNIGTCITAVLASIGTKVNARRATAIHVMFNVIGTVIFTIICMAVPFADWVEAMTPGNHVAQIANVHTIFNISTTLLLLPFGNLMARIAVKLLPDSKVEEEQSLRLAYIAPFESNYVVGHSALVISQVNSELSRMLGMVEKNVEQSFHAILSKSGEKYEDIEAREEYIDYLNTEITKYITKLMVTEISEQDTKSINGFFSIAGNLERIGDHAMNIAGYARNLDTWGIKFSESAMEEIGQMQDICRATLKSLRVVDGDDKKLILERAAKHEQRIDDMEESYRKHQIQRMQKGSCQAQASLLFSELLSDFERIGDHALNIAEQYHEMV